MSSNTFYLFGIADASTSHARSDLPPSEPDVEPKKYRYPKAVVFILGNEVCERFCYNGLRAILALYLKNVLSYTTHEATAIIHFFVLLCYFFPLIGAIIADSFLGKFRTIVYLSIVYVIGTLVLASSSIENIGIPHKELLFVGLILIAIGTGGIKPCVSSFGGDQFKMPEQAKQLAQFFSLFYLSINIGSCISTAITPIIRKISCLGADSCYPLSFGLPSLLMIIATVIFVVGKPLYIIKKPGRNIILDVIKCTSHAISNRCKKGKTEKQKHWMDYASDKYDDKLISDVKALFSVTLIFLPAPFFWALFDQQSSTWVFQAEKMDGSLGSGLELLPEQIQVLNPILIVILVPLFEFGLYPLFDKMRILTTPLQKFGAGLLLAAVAFVISAGLEFIILRSNPSRVHMAWQCPQIFVMACAEIMFSIQAINFGFTQAPIELKSVVSALWLLTSAFGNLIVVFISGASLFSNMAWEFLLYAGLIVIDFVFFLFLAMHYVYRTYND